MSVLSPAAAEEEDREGGAKAAAGNACADNTDGNVGGGSSGTGCRRPSPVPPMLLFEARDAAALVFSSLVAAALATRLSLLLAVWALAEGGFYLWQRYRYKIVHAEPVLDAAIEPERMEMLEERLLSLSEIISLDDFLSGWFRGAPRKSIFRGNVEDFIAYGFHAKKLEDLSPGDRAGVSEFVDRIQVAYSTTFAAGRNPDIEFMAHLWEPLKVIHSPLAVRLTLEALRLSTVLALTLFGFRRGTVDIEEGARGGRGSRFEFWVLPPAAAAAAVEEEGKKDRKEDEEDEEEGKRTEGGSQQGLPAPAAAPAGVAAAGGRLLRNDSNNGSGLFHFSRRRRRNQRSMRNPSITLVDSASSLEGEPSVDLEEIGEGTRDAGGGGGEASPLLLDNIDDGEPASPSSRDDDGENDPSTAPILFLHGVGLGITPYLLFVAALRRRFPRRPLLLLEARHVSVGLVPTRAASTCDVAQAAFEAMRRNNWRSAAVVAHSYGTFVAARMLAVKPEAVQSLVLLDPVCALTIYPQLLANFVYKPPVALLSTNEKQRAENRSRGGYFWPKQGGEEDEEEAEASPTTSPSPPPPPPPPPPSSPFVAAASAAASAAATAWALLTAFDSARFLFSRDLTVGEAFCRRFAWHRECLWPQDLRHAGRSTLFGLAGGDDLVPGALVRRALAATGSGASVSGNDDPRAGHGGFLIDREWQRRLLDGAEVVIEAGAEEERAEKKEMRRRARRRRMSERAQEEEVDVPAKGKAAAAAPVSCAAAAKLLDAFSAADTTPDSPPPRPVTADIGERGGRKLRKAARTFSSSRVVPVVLEAL